MAINLPRKSEPPQLGNFTEVLIGTLSTKFDHLKGEWINESEIDHLNSIHSCQTEISKQRAIEEKIQNELITKNILLDRIKKEIRMILSDKSEILERKGFAVTDLLSKLT